MPAQGRARLAALSSAKGARVIQKYAKTRENRIADPKPLLARGPLGTSVPGGMLIAF